MSRQMSCTTHLANRLTSPIIPKNASRMALAIFLEGLLPFLKKLEDCLWNIWPFEGGTKRIVDNLHDSVCHASGAYIYYNFCFLPFYIEPGPQPSCHGMF